MKKRLRKDRNHPPIQGLEFIKEYYTLKEVLQDKALSKLGDSYANFVYSLAKSIREKEIVNERVPGKILAEAIKRAGLRGYLPNRISRHDQGDAAEALIGYAWLWGAVSFEECVNVLSCMEDDPTEAFVNLIKSIIERLNMVGWKKE